MRGKVLRSEEIRGLTWFPAMGLGKSWDKVSFDEGVGSFGHGNSKFTLALPQTCSEDFNIQNA